MDVAKKFTWEAAHRLENDQGKCGNLHGHSYTMWVRLDGETNSDGMVLDFREIKKIVSPIMSKLDHALMICESDEELFEFVKESGLKHYTFANPTTSENLAEYFGNLISERLPQSLDNIDSCTVKVQETETCFAVYTTTV